MYPDDTLKFKGVEWSPDHNGQYQLTKANQSAQAGRDGGSTVLSELPIIDGSHSQIVRVDLDATVEEGCLLGITKGRMTDYNQNMSKAKEAVNYNSRSGSIYHRENGY